VSVVPQVSGQIISAGFKQGQVVRAGDLLYSIDPRVYEANLKKAEAQLEVARAKFDVDSAQFDRSKVLLPSNYISQQQYEAYEAQVRQDKANLDAAVAQVSQAQLDLEHCNITSPINGVAGTYLVDVGNVVGAMSLGKPLVTVENVDRLYIEFSISENDFHTLQHSFQAGEGRLTVEVMPLSDESICGEASVEFIDNSINKKTGSIKLRAPMKNDDHRFWPGQSVRARLLLTTLKDAVLVPSEAVKLGQQGRYVFVVKDDKSVELRPVEVGQLHGKMIVVVRGVAAGEAVVQRGQLMLAPGMSVAEMPDDRIGVFEQKAEQNKKIAEKNPTTK
jgi:multidrug efflux system membrane fusion protein